MSGSEKLNYQGELSTRLRVKLSLLCNPERYHQSSISKEDARSWFREYLITAHSIIRSSVPLMRAAHLQCSSVLDKQDLLIKLQDYFKSHINEERGHDDWILEDLEVIGIPRCECLERKPPQIVAELVGTQYYWIYHWHPVSLLGYISFLEGNPPRDEWIRHLRKTTEYPEAAFRTIVMHSELDPCHRDDLDELLDTLPLTIEQKHWIINNALYSAKKFHDIWHPP